MQRIVFKCVSDCDRFSHVSRLHPEYARKGGNPNYPSLGEKLAENRLRAERPELARHYDRVREQERAKEEAERQTADRASPATRARA